MEKLKYDDEDVKRVCFFAIENEKRKGNNPSNIDGSSLSKEQYYQETIALFKSKSFIEDIKKMSKKKP